MKIGVLIRQFVTNRGAERYAVEITRRLAAKHEVHVFAQDWDNEPPGVTMHRVPLLLKKPSVFNQWWFSWHTARMTKAAGMDLVHAHERVTQFDVMNIHVGTYIEGIWGEVRGDHRNRFKTWLKVLTTPSIWAYMRLEKLHSQTAPGRFWVPDSDMVKREMQHYYPTPDDRFFIAHSGVDQPERDAAERRTQWRAKLGLRADEVAALFVGSEFRRKGLPALLEAMAILKEKAPHLVIVGGKELELEPCQKRASELGINERLTWAGRVNNVKDYYSLADIFVLPTLSDASPIAPLEAMAYGCATIVSNGRYTGAAELIRNGEAIILDDPRNATEIAQAMERLLNPQARQEIARRGQELVRAFTWDRTAAVIMEAIEKSHKEKAVAHG